MPLVTSAQEAEKVFRAGFLNAGANISKIHPLGDALRKL